MAHKKVTALSRASEPAAVILSEAKELEVENGA